MKLSIITITFNSENSIRDTIESVLSQEYDDLEYIIVDGASNDSTMDIVREYQDQISKIVSEKDKGLYDALNKGISMATGDVIGFLHSDDVYANRNVLDTIAEVFERYDLDSVYGDLVYVEKENTNKVIRFWKSGSFSRSKVRKGWMPPHPTFFVKREMYEKFGNFDLSFSIAADYDLVLRFLYKYSISTYYLPLILIKMRIGGESNKNLSKIIKKSKEDIRAMKRNGVNFVVALFFKNLTKLVQFFKPAWVDRYLYTDNE